MSNKQRRPSSDKFATPGKGKTPGKRMPLTPRNANVPYQRNVNPFKAWANSGPTANSLGSLDEVAPVAEAAPQPGGGEIESMSVKVKELEAERDANASKLTEVESF